MQFFSAKRLRNLLLAILLGSGLLDYGQSTSASLTGQITDPSGAAIPEATVTITNIGTGFTQTVNTDAVGEYLLRPLPVGNYSLTVNARGFDHYVQKGIVLTANLSATQDIHLKVGTGNETVSVTADTELVNTTSAELGTTVNEAAISELPLNGRDPSSLVLLAPGTSNVIQRGGEGIQSGFSFPTETGASSSGGRQGSTFYMLDGVSNMDNYNDLTAPFPNSDATQEFKVITNNFSAVYGFSPGAVVSIATKSGSNSFHGGTFWFVRNNDLNAANWFSGPAWPNNPVKAIDPLKRNQFGGYLGGPVLKDKLFFFGNYQGTRLVEAAATNTTYTPTTAMLTGDFSGLAATPGVTNLLGPFHTVNGAANQLDTSIAKLDSAAVQIAKDGLPTSSSQAADGKMNYVAAAVSQNFNEYTWKLDYDLSPSQRLTLRSFTNEMTEPSGDTPGNILSVLNLSNWSYDFQEKMEYYNDVLEHTWTINPATVNTASVFWSENSAHNSAPTDDSSGKPMCWSRYINVTELPGQCWMEGFAATGGSVAGNGFNGGWTEPSQEVRRTYGLTDTLQRNISRHTFSAGINLLHQYAEEYTQYPATPIITFNGQYTGAALADYLLGYMDTFEQGAGEIADVAGWQLGPYFQDDWRVRPNLTVNLGLRWDPNLAPSSAGGRGAAFVAGQQSTMFPNAPLGLIFPGDKGVTSALMPDSYGYWEPRLGVAWQPKFLAHTVFHAGFGLFTGPLEYSSYNHAADIAPFSPTFELYGGGATCASMTKGACTPSVDQAVTGQLSLDNPWSANASTGKKSPFPPFASVSYVPPSNSPIAGGAKLGQSFARNFKMSVTQSWNVSAEQQLTPTTVFRLAYVGAESYHQSDAVDENAYIGNVAPYPDFSNIYQLNSNGTASYNSLQATLDHHLSRGLQVQSSFTWSKAIDVASSGNISFGSPYLPDPFDLRWNRGVSSLSVPFNSVTNFIYHAPSMNGRNKLIQETLGGWELSSIVTWQSGNPFTIQASANGGNNSGSNQYLDRADRVPGQALNVHQGSRSHWLTDYFNTAAFVNNAPGTFGDSGKNIMFGPHYFGDDSAIMKSWGLVEGMTLQFRWEAFNALNHPTFGNPSGDYGNTVTYSSFGQIGTIGNIPPRVMQGALKLMF